MPVPNKHTNPHQFHTQFKKTAETATSCCWARPQKDMAQQPTYCNQPHLSLISLNFPINAPPRPILMPLLPTSDPSPGHVPSPGHTVSSHFPATSPGSPHGAGGKSPSLFSRALKQGRYFLLFPTANYIPNEHQGTTWVCSTPKVSQENIGFNQRSSALV